MASKAPFTLRQGALAATLTASAGFVDGLGFIHLGGYFVSFMSGNSTRAGSDLAQGDVGGWLKAVGLVAFFLVGVIASSVALHRYSRRRGGQAGIDDGPQAPAVWVSLILVTLAAILGAVALTAEGSVGALALAAVPPTVAAGMGAVNGTFTRGGEVTVGLTYMTGTLVKIGQHLVGAFTGGDRTAWLWYLGLWSAISLGAVAGSFAYLWWDLWALWLVVPPLLTVAVLLQLRRSAAVPHWRGTA